MELEPNIPGVRNVKVVATLTTGACIDVALETVVQVADRSKPQERERVLRQAAEELLNALPTEKAMQIEEQIEEGGGIPKEPHPVYNTLVKEIRELNKHLKTEREADGKKDTDKPGGA
jgi:hypothetical protein